MSIKTIITTLAASSAVLIMPVYAIAGEDKYDKGLEAKIIAKVQEKIGDIRPTIDHETTVVLVTKKHLRDAEANSSHYNIRKIWVAPKPDNALPPVVSRERDRPLLSNNKMDVDYTFTAGIGRKLPGTQPKIIWEKYDGKGNRIN